MATYCEPEDLGRFGIRAKALERFSVEDQIRPAIVAASARIDKYLGRVLVLPLVGWDDALVECAAVLATWNVLSTEGIRPDENPEDTVLRMKYKDMIAWLTDISTGKASTAGLDGSPPASGSAAPGAPRISSNESRGYQGGRATFSGQRR